MQRGADLVNYLLSTGKVDVNQQDKEGMGASSTSHMESVADYCILELRLTYRTRKGWSLAVSEGNLDLIVLFVTH